MIHQEIAATRDKRPLGHEEFNAMLQDAIFEMIQRHPGEPPQTMCKDIAAAVLRAVDDAGYGFYFKRPADAQPAEGG